MRKKRRNISLFSMSFLDVMFCGFGAVVLLVMIVNTGIVQQRREVRRDLRGEIELLQRQVLDETRTLASLRNTLERSASERVIAQGLAEALLSELQSTESSLQDLRAETLASRAHFNRLKSDLKSLEQERRRLKERAAEQAAAEGDKLRRVSGDGDRQYLTGLKVGGRRIAVLLDVSTSMLAETLVNVIRTRNLPERERLRSRKWRQAVDTVGWITAQIPASSKFQIYVFNDRARALLEGSEGRWLEAGDARRVNAALDALRQLVPDKGSSLARGFQALSALKPRPDNIFLITDALPTQGRSRPSSGTVSPEKRFRLFQQAMEDLPGGVPVNVVLLPLEGDPEAASAYWKLAMRTGGTLLSPSVDWP